MLHVDLKNIVPKGGLTCLFAKATSDESKLWHRRLGHINFKTMNKLVKGNLVRGLPLTLFENNQTELLVYKGQAQHRASLNKKVERGIVIKNKARLVAQGYTQEEGIGYDEVFAPVARIEAIRLFLAYASFKDFVVYQIDVKSAFLYGKIKEEVYVCQPSGFKDPNFPDRVYKVEKALYGLHQAPRSWYETLLTYLLDNGFQRGEIDKTLFIRRDKDDILLVQVCFQGLVKDDDKDVGAEADMNNLDAFMRVSPIPTTRVNKDHPVEQIIRDLNSAPQTRRMTNNLKEHEEPKKNKKDERGIVIKNKARLVAQGYTQEEGIDYDEVILKEEDLLCLSTTYDFEDPDFPDRVYKVEKALYGLHQAPRAWYETLSTYLLDNGFQRGKIDKTLFIRRDKGDILLVQIQDSNVTVILKKFGVYWDVRQHAHYGNSKASAQV
ncbi:putative ribonuclease H-like domain-containing protein [Tanacetum coccineum]